ncbi:zf-HC2 domain-containing protein [Lysinibacillus sp. SGAir0095]|uniref:zf-HC2 domain-containing protein n=1 Tax=Lysinibacillus sp. SGAir0095 TaxID=2070463 RepID=UPI0010CD544C|nr:zf-HC2 domain-containing protein [Lysinibacillus sp. SGAir0095]QCR31191.1 hypothetical protein C1N55_03020 [Lysinibacillus sp. SGAir0095]
MKEIKCTIIQDVLPLYIDGVVSPDTKEMVDEHLKHCEKCQKELESMKQELYLPVENKDSLLKSFSKKWRNKKIMIALGSILGTAILLFGAFSYVFYYEKVIPYSEDLIKIEAPNNQQLVLHYFGKSYAGVHETHPMSLEIDGEKKNVSFIFYTQTIAHSPTRNLLDDDGQNEHNYISVLPESEKIDAVYYAGFDVEDISFGKDSWDDILERADLIWERE